MSTYESNTMLATALQFYSVKEIAGTIKQSLEASFSSIRIKGEVSGVVYHKSGHVYFSLKEDDAVIDCITWKGMAKTFQTPLSDGLSIIGSGYITTYPGRSKYQFIMDSFDLEGIGELYKLLEARKIKLQNEGLFDPEKKRSIPRLPKRIGLITSSEGSVLHDIIARLEERFVEKGVFLWPVTVQGENTPKDVIAAIRGFHLFRDRPDVIVIARGGGSFEDLWFFNDEDMARTIRSSEIPIITAIGHEPDTPLIDYVSDRRASTPTNAAEIVAPKKQDILAYLDRLHQRTKAVLQNTTQIATSRLHQVSHISQMAQLYFAPLRSKMDSIQLLRFLEKCHLTKKATWESIAARCVSPKMIMESKRTSVKVQEERLIGAIKQDYANKRMELDALKLRLENSNFTQLLQRGFSIVMSNNKIISSCSELRNEQEISLRLKDGVVNGKFLLKM